MGNSKFLHVVAFNVPYPPNYGGIIDIYYKLAAFKDANVKVILHCFSYGREKTEALDKLCHKVYYYKRKNLFRFFFSSLPYIVITRKDEELVKNLTKDGHPVLFEGLHSSYFLLQCKSVGKNVFVRTHNIEHNYYGMLARSERNLFKKAYLLAETRKLKAYETILKRADQLFAISKTDNAHFNKHYGNSTFVSAFHQHNEISSKTGKGDYILFHGNLSVPENEKALIYLVKNVFSKITHHVKIAGKNPSQFTQRLCNRHTHIELIGNPDDNQMKSLVNDAHINLLYTYQPTGLKLKLLHSLHGGRFCMANPLMLSGSGLDDLCEVYTTTDKAVQMIDELMKTPFDKSQITKRINLLAGYKNTVNIQKITNQLSFCV